MNLSKRDTLKSLAALGAAAAAPLAAGSALQPQVDALLGLLE